MTHIITKRDNDSFHIVGESNKCNELADMLIRAFANESSHNREILTNNTLMPSLQVKLVLGEEAFQSLNQYDANDWEAAWILFNDHYDRI